MRSGLTWPDGLESAKELYVAFYRKAKPAFQAFVGHSEKMTTQKTESHILESEMRGLPNKAEQAFQTFFSSTDDAKSKVLEFTKRAK